MLMISLMTVVSTFAKVEVEEEEEEEVLAVVSTGGVVVSSEGVVVSTGGVVVSTGGVVVGGAVITKPSVEGSTYTHKKLL